MQGPFQDGVLVCPFSSVQFPNPVYSVKSNITASSFTNNSEDLQRERTYVLIYLNTYTATYILTIILKYLHLYIYTTSDFHNIFLSTSYVRVQHLPIPVWPAPGLIRDFIFIMETSLVV